MWLAGGKGCPRRLGLWAGQLGVPESDIVRRIPIAADLSALKGISRCYCGPIRVAIGAVLRKGTSENPATYLSQVPTKVPTCAKAQFFRFALSVLKEWRALGDDFRTLCLGNLAYLSQPDPSWYELR